MVNGIQDLLGRQLLADGPQSFPVNQSFPAQPLPLVPQVTPTTGAPAPQIAPAAPQQLAQGLTGGGVVAAPQQQVSPLTPTSGALDVRQGLAESLLETR